MFASTQCGDGFVLARIDGSRIDVYYIDQGAGQVKLLASGETEKPILEAYLSLFAISNKLLVIVRMFSNFSFSWLTLGMARQQILAFSAMFSCNAPAAHVPVVFAANHGRLALFISGDGLRISDVVKSSSILFSNGPAAWVTDHSQHRTYFPVDQETAISVAQSAHNESTLLLHSIGNLAPPPAPRIDQ